MRRNPPSRVTFKRFGVRDSVLFTQATRFEEITENDLAECGLHAAASCKQFLRASPYLGMIVLTVPQIAMKQLYIITQ